MQYRTIRAAIHSAYFRPSCSLAKQAPLTAAGLQHRYPAKQHTGMLCLLFQILSGQGGRQASECSAFVEQQVAMSAALSTASEPLARLAGQHASTLTPKTLACLENWHSQAPSSQGTGGITRGFSQSWNPPAAPAPYMASSTAGSEPATARCCPQHHCQNHPTMGPVSTAPAPAKHIPHC